jgi:Fe-S cluster assembly protein SufB
MEWVDGNIGSRLTMKYPSVYLMGRGARGEVLSVAYAGKGQHQDAGAKMVHNAPDTTSVITNKSVSKGGGKTTYRGLVKVHPGATGAKINVNCDALILDNKSKSDIEVEEAKVTLAHEATVGRVGEEQLFYLMSRGISEAEAMSMIVLGFMEPFTRELPMEYAVELNRLIQLEMEGSVG